MKKILLLAASCAFLSTAQAQMIGDTAGGHHLVHHVGVQINELFRQIFNFNSSSSASANTNPFLLTYSVNSVRSGWGARIGIGYNYQSFTNDDGTNRKTTDLNDLQARLGFEKASRLGEKWTAGVGLDAVLNRADDYTKSEIRSFDTVTTTTTTKFDTYGGGAMVWLRYHLSKHVLIGTEASYYYTAGNEKDQIAITRRDFNGTTRELETTISRVDNDKRDGKLSVPTAFFLIVTF